jgi:hypothetical protein
MPMNNYKRRMKGSAGLSVAARRKSRNNHGKTKLGKIEIKKLLFQLSQNDLIELLEELESRLETFEMMRLAESGFGEWLEEGEDIYEEK